MKTQVTLAVFALLNCASATSINEIAAKKYTIQDNKYIVFEQAQVKKGKNCHKTGDLPSDEICDGDSADNKNLEHEGDHNDDIVEDHGFSGSRHARIGGLSQENIELNAQLNLKEQKKSLIQLNEKPASGDFVQVKGDSIPLFANYDFKNYFPEPTRYSDSLCNGDYDDDKEVEFEHDMTDDIVDFNGHTNAGYAHTVYQDLDEAHFKDNTITNLFPDHFGTVPREDFVQLKGQPEFSEYTSHKVGKDWALIQKMAQEKKAQALEQNNFVQLGKIQGGISPPKSSQLLQLSSQDDDSDLEKFGFKPTNKHCKIAQLDGMQSNYCASAPESSVSIRESQLVQLDDETTDVEELAQIGFNPTPKHWKMMELEKKADSNNQPPAQELVQTSFENYPINTDHMNIMFKLMDEGERYSDSLANGDKDDDKETQFEHDMNDDIVDMNGHTNAGYGHTAYADFDEAHFANNKVDSLFSGHFGTVPREDFIQTKVNQHRHLY